MHGIECCLSFQTRVHLLVNIYVALFPPRHELHTEQVVVVEERQLDESLSYCRKHLWRFTEPRLCSAGSHRGYEGKRFLSDEVWPCRTCEVRQRETD